MDPYRRYALYYTPPAGSFADFGAGWLGWDLTGGRAVVQPELPGLDLPQITEEPRRYGFHATLKPPFRLADHVTASGLRDAVAELAETLDPVILPGLELKRIGSFLALTPRGDMSELNRLAAATVSRIDSFRAPLNDQEIARRRPDRLSERQRVLLDRWGYPYVMEEFRFHMTLTGSLDEKVLDLVENALSGLTDALPLPFTLDALSLVGERADRNFQLIESFPL